MKVLIEIKYLGETVDMLVDFDDEVLVDESYNLGREINQDIIENHFLDNVEVNVISMD